MPWCATRASPISSRPPALGSPHSKWFSLPASPSPPPSLLVGLRGITRRPTITGRHEAGFCGKQALLRVDAIPESRWGGLPTYRMLFFKRILTEPAVAAAAAAAPIVERRSEQRFAISPEFP